MSVPSAPILTSDNVEPSESGIIVVPQVPISDGGSAIIDYQIERNKKGAGFTLRTTLLAADLGDGYLDTGTGIGDDVIYRVRCRNADGYSDYSAQREVTSQGPLGPETSVGGGETAVDHDGGSGVLIDGQASESDALQYLTPESDGVPGLVISAYLVSEFNAEPPVRQSKGTTRTGSDGRWISALMLDSGTYYLIADLPDDGFKTQLNTVVVP